MNTQNRLLRGTRQCHYIVGTSNLCDYLSLLSHPAQVYFHCICFQSTQHTSHESFCN